MVTFSFAVQREAATAAASSKCPTSNRRKNWNGLTDRGSPKADDFHSEWKGWTKRGGSSPDSMRLTLAWLCVCLAIYCGGGFANNGQGNVALSLPPSLIAATEAVALRQLHQKQLQQQQHQRHEQPRWKKDARVLFDSGNADALHDMMHSKEPETAAGKNNLPYNDDMDVEQQQHSEQQQQQQPQSMDFNRKALSESYDLEARRQSAPQEIAQLHGYGHGHGQGQGVGLKYATPIPTPALNPKSKSNYWAKLCQANANCPREYNRAMLAVRNREAVARLQRQLYQVQDQLDSDYKDANDDDTDDMDDSREDLHSKNNSNEVFLLLTGEQDLVKFLHWAMQLLYPHQYSDIKLDANDADFYHPGMFIWKKLNFSGHLEPPLIVDEPQFVLVRREKQNSEDAYRLGDELKGQDDPFIPPRGRKQHNGPDLDALLNRFETFVPNRGKRDKVKDLFKYDDLFFPNRGKKHRDILKLNDPFYPHRGKKLELRDLYNVDDPFFPNRGKRQSTAGGEKWGGKVQRKLQENDIDTGDNWPQRMSTHEINSNDQSVKSSMSTEDATNAAAATTTAAGVAGAAAESKRWPLTGLVANRLHSTRSMSANLQQSPASLRRLLQRLQLIANPGMRQQLQVKTSFPATRLQRSLRSLHIARETQLTRGSNESSDHGSDTDNDTDSGTGKGTGMGMDSDTETETDMDTDPDTDNDIDIDYGQLDM